MGAVAFQRRALCRDQQPDYSGRFSILNGECHAVFTEPKPYTDSNFQEVAWCRNISPCERVHAEARREGKNQKV